MKIWQLMILVLVLSVGVALALTNPSMDAYLDFVETELRTALDRSEPAHPDKERIMIRTIFRKHSHELVATVVRPHTIRSDWGLVSRFETTVFGTQIDVLGIGGVFIPLKGIDEAIHKIGRLAF